MQIPRVLLVTVILFLSYSCQADGKPKNDSAVVKMLVEQYFPKEAGLSANAKPLFRLGDFNGDDIEDIAAVLLPDAEFVAIDRVAISLPWNYSGVVDAEKYRKSIFIFNGHKEGWSAKKASVFAMLDKLGVLETPSFDLIVNSVGDKEYKDNIEMLPGKVSSDLLIVPTEAGIDTYIYWDGTSYQLFEPDEQP